MNVAVLMSCHNRCEMTLNCLARLASAFDATADCSFKVFLTDDGSTDGTAVNRFFTAFLFDFQLFFTDRANFFDRVVFGGEFISRNQIVTEGMLHLQPI